MKRAVFGRIQMGSWIPTSGCSPFPIRTAFEDLIAYRAGKKYAFSAKQDGVIKVITDTAMSVTYKDGTTESCKMGVWFGTVPGKKIQHENVTDRKEGYRFKAGEVLMWNKYFFCRSWMVPTRCSFMTGALALVAWSETLATDEDGSRYSDRLSLLLTTPKVYERTIKATFSDDIVGLVKVGDEVEYDTVLCSIVPSQANVGDIKDANTLAGMGNIAPKAETAGHVTAIEVYYRGELTNASDSVKKIIREDNRKRKATVAVMKSGSETGELTVSSPYGTKIFDDALHIKIYITHEMPFEEGDKYVVSNQLKSVPGQSFEQKLFTTNSGEFVDMQFSYKAAKARIVWSYNKGVIAIIVRQICRNGVRVALGEKPMKNTGEPQHVPV